MKTSSYLAQLLLIVFFAGCGLAPRSTQNQTSAPDDSAPHAGPGTILIGDTEGLTSAEIDSLFTVTEWLIDSLAVEIDSLANAPDISDSLAALTEATLPTGDELFDYPVVINRRVLAWLDLYQGKSKGTFNRNLERSGRYLVMARRIFAEEGIPQDLAAMAHIESGFRHNARSPARALGLWQFMRGTARLYGLRCDSYVDERLDPEKSTRAAARYLRDLYKEFGDWYLAMAAYNTGSGRVARAIRRTGSRDFWHIAGSRYLVNETRNFVPAILSATILSKSPGAYGYTEKTAPPLEYDTVIVDSPTDLRVIAGCIDIPLTTAQDLNPALLLLQTPPEAPAYEIHVPKGLGETFAREFGKIPPAQRLVFHRHKVKRNETLGHLAHRYNTTVLAIQDANRMGRRTTIYVGQTLRIPSQGMPGTYLADLERENAIKHRVRRGECLGNIAKRYGVSIKAIQACNDIPDPRRIYAGQELTVPPSRRPRKLESKPVPLPVPDEQDLAMTELSALGTNGNGTSRELRAKNTSNSLGRVPTTAHLVEEAREAIQREVETSPPPSPPRIHRVRRGDTLSEIAARHGVSISTLRRWNSLKRDGIIYPGQQLLVSDPLGGDGAPRSEGNARLHIVQRGESLWEISKRYGVRVADLASWNRLSHRATIHPGQKLHVY